MPLQRYIEAVVAYHCTVSTSSLYGVNRTNNHRYLPPVVCKHYVDFQLCQKHRYRRRWGNSGSHMVTELLKSGRHNITAISRVDSQSKLPNGIKFKHIDYDKHDTIVEAFRGQDVLIITLSIARPKDTAYKLIRAALEAGVPWILPNDWAPDTADEDLVKDVPAFQEAPEIRKIIKEDSCSSYISVLTGFWYEWSLAIPAAFGIDLVKHEATLFDEGETKISISTWPQVGRAVAALLSLPIKAERSRKGLEDYRDQIVYVSSFTVSQKQMLESAFRVTGTKASDWNITEECAQKRHEDGKEALYKGDQTGFMRLMHSRVFYDDGNGDFESRRGTLNGVLGLPKEDLDKATEAALERAKTTRWP